MATQKQLILKKCRKAKESRIKTPALQKNPQLKGICTKILIRTPKKPNSAQRKVAKIRLSNKLIVVAYIPGVGHSLQEYSAVLMRGGRVKDLPGVKYHLIRGKYDFRGIEKLKYARSNARSKYGTKIEKKKLS